MASPVSDVYVRLPSGQTITLAVQPRDTVAGMATQTADRAGVPADRLRLKYQGKVLNPAHTAGYLGVRTETILKAEIIDVKKLTIYVQMTSGDAFPVTVDNVSPILHIKNRILDKEGIPCDRQRLKMGSRVLTDESQSLHDAGVTHESVVTVETRDPPETKSGNTPGGATDTDALDDSARQAVLGSFDAAGRRVDVVFCFDTTGSMYRCLALVRLKLREACNRLLADIANIRIGVIAHGDYCDQTSSYVVRMLDLTSDVDSLVEFVENVPSTGGGDSPECYEWALHKAQQLEWSENSAKALVMIGDCLPHPVSYTDQKVNWHDELDILKAMGVKVYGIQAYQLSGNDAFYREISEHTGGAYVTFSNFDVITDMFLAVCYREAAPEQLEAFLEEVEQGGRMEGDVEAVLHQVQEAPVAPLESTQRYIAEPWWDPNLDQGRPSYTYNPLTDSWKSTSHVIRPSACWTTPATTTSATSSDTRPAAATSAITASSTRGIANSLREAFRRFHRSFRRRSSRAQP